MSSRLQFGMRRPDWPRGPRIDIDFEGQSLPAHQGESVAAALLAAGVRIFSRSIKFHRPRSVFCLSGDCGSCLMRIDGQPNLRACRTAVHPGLRCHRQNAWPSASFDIMATADDLFPDGMDHHTLLTEPRPLNAAMQKVVQQLGGLGQLPDASPPFASLPPSRSRQVDVVVVGAGPAGLAAATAIAEASRDPTCSVLLVEAGLELGGSYLTDPRFGPAAAAAAEARARAAGVELHVATAAFGYYAEEQLLAVATPDGILKLRAPRYLYATGGHEQNLLFVDNDRPGVLPARAVGRIHTHYGLAVGERPLIVGDSDYASALAAALTDSGAQVRTIDGRRQRLHAARGRGWVSGAVIVDERGGEQQLDCDLIAIATPPAPAFELGKLHGAAIRFDDQRGFVLDVDDHGRTSAERLWACGEVTGQTGVAAALAHGQRVGAAIAAERG